MVNPKHFNFKNQNRFDCDIVFLAGLSSGDGTQSSFVEALQKYLGHCARINLPTLEKMDRSSTAHALNAIMREFSHLRNPVVIGHSLGGLWAIYLARMGFTRQVIAISPALPSNFMQIDPLRLQIFWKNLIFGIPFRFTEGTIREQLMQNVSEEVIRECVPHFRDEPASLIREYARMGPQLRLSQDDITYVQNRVSGLVLTGLGDRICPAGMQQELARMLAFRHETLVCGHSPHLGNDRHEVLDSISHFLAPLASHQKFEEVS